jgi:hypothetical protein
MNSDISYLPHLISIYAFAQLLGELQLDLDLRVKIQA